MSNTVTKKTYLIVGATRGIGRAVLDILSERSDARVIAGVRDVNAPIARELAAKTNVTVVEIDSARDGTPSSAVKTLTAQGITTVDVVLANAGISGEDVPAVDTTPDTLRTLLNINTIAPLLLFAAFAPLLKRSSSPRFLVTSSLIGSFGNADELFAMFETNKHEFTTYAVSKTAVNTITKRIALENRWLIAIPLHPGLVATDMSASKVGSEALNDLVQAGHAITASDSGRGIVKLIDEAQLKTHSGRFYDVQADKFAEY